jgi:hypothetical protein
MDKREQIDDSEIRPIKNVRRGPRSGVRIRVENPEATAPEKKGADERPDQRPSTLPQISRIEIEDELERVIKLQSRRRRSEIRTWEADMSFWGASTDAREFGEGTMTLEEQTALTVAYDKDGRQVEAWTIPVTEEEIKAALVDLERIAHRLVEYGLSEELGEAIRTQCGAVGTAGRLPHSSIRPTLVLYDKRGLSILEAWFYKGEIHREADRAVAAWTSNRENQETEPSLKIGLVASQVIDDLLENTDELQNEAGVLELWPARCDRWRL